MVEEQHTLADSHQKALPCFYCEILVYISHNIIQMNIVSLLIISMNNLLIIEEEEVNYV